MTDRRPVAATPAAAPALLRRPWVARAGTMTAHARGRLGLSAPAVVAPVVAPMLGFGPERVGLFVGIAYLAAMIAGLASGHGVARLGAVGVTQLALLAFAMGMAVAPVGTGPVLVAAALLLGVGYGQLNPSAASLLNRHAPPAHRGLVFSLKQSAVPLGVALSGLLMPPALASLGWRATIEVLAASCAGCLLLLFATRRLLDGTLEAGSPSAAAAAGGSDGSRPDQARVARPGAPSPRPLRPLRVVRLEHWALARVLRDPPLRLLSLASFAYAFSQLAFMTFLVSYLHLELDWSLASAAAMLAASQGVATVARVGWGAVADRWMAPDRLLGWLGIGSALGLLALGVHGIDGRADRPLVTVAACLACALTTMSWNGVFFTELARRTTQTTLASYAGAAQFLTFCGSMAGPVVFGEMLRAGCSYALAYTLIILLPLAAGAALLRASRRETSAPA